MAKFGPSRVAGSNGGLPCPPLRRRVSFWMGFACRRWAHLLQQSLCHTCKACHDHDKRYPTRPQNSWTMGGARVNALFKFISKDLFPCSFCLTDWICFCLNILYFSQQFILSLLSHIFVDHLYSYKTLIILKTRARATARVSILSICITIWERVCRQDWGRRCWWMEPRWGEKS